MASNAQQSAQIPSQIGTRYNVLEQLGKGGMAIAYRVLDTGRNAEVALKQLMGPEDPERRRRINALFEREFSVAIEAKDRPAAEHFIQLLAQHGRADAGRVLLPRHVQLSDDARRAGMALDLPETIFQTQVLAPRMYSSRDAAVSMVATAFAHATDAADRAERALSLLCEAAGDISGGQLYLAQASGLHLAASQVLSVDADLAAQIRSYWLQLATDDGSTAMLTNTQDGDAPKTEIWQRTDGARCRPIVLRSIGPDGPRCVGLVVLASPSVAPLEPQVWELAAVLGGRLLELGDAEGLNLD